MLNSSHLKLIGRTGAYYINGMTFYVMIDDVKSAYGNIRYLIHPIAGSKKSTWVNEESVKLD